jgi:hypothetical protein
MLRTSVAVILGQKRFSELPLGVSDWYSTTANVLPDVLRRGRGRMGAAQLYPNGTPAIFVGWVTGFF